VTGALFLALGAYETRVAGALKRLEKAKFDVTCVPGVVPSDRSVVVLRVKATKGHRGKVRDDIDRPTPQTGPLSPALQCSITNLAEADPRNIGLGGAVYRPGSPREKEFVVAWVAITANELPIAKPRTFYIVNETGAPLTLYWSPLMKVRLEGGGSSYEQAPQKVDLRGITLEPARRPEEPG